MYLNFKKVNESDIIEFSIDRHFDVIQTNNEEVNQSFYPLDLETGVYYSLDSENWIKYKWTNTSQSTYNTYVLNVGETITLGTNNNIIYFKGNLKRTPSHHITFIIDGGPVYGDGEVTSIYDESDVFSDTWLNSFAFVGLFSGCTNLITPPKLSSLSLGMGCYYRMFYGCTNLIKAPYLPAHNIPPYAYREIFYNCNSLSSIEMDAIHYMDNAFKDWINVYNNEGEITLVSTFSYENISIPQNWNIKTKNVPIFTNKELEYLKKQNTYGIRAFKLDNLTNSNFFTNDCPKPFFYPMRNGTSYMSYFEYCDISTEFIEALLPGSYLVKITNTLGQLLYEQSFNQLNDGKNTYPFYFQYDRPTAWPISPYYITVQFITEIGIIKAISMLA